jgi:hypothetical protein
MDAGRPKSAAFDFLVLKQDEGERCRKLHLLVEEKYQGGSIWHDILVPSAGNAGVKG